jgi:hypothetical protein
MSAVATKRSRSSTVAKVKIVGPPLRLPGGAWLWAKRDTRLVCPHRQKSGEREAGNREAMLFARHPQWINRGAKGLGV